MSSVSRREWIIRFALMLGSLCAAIVLAEVAYRIKLAASPFKPLHGEPDKFTATPNVFGVYDAEVGLRCEPGTSHIGASIVEDGRVTYVADEPTAACNRDGYSGRTLRDEYARADVKIAIYGDSFCNWRQGGETWPDIMQRSLTGKLGRSAGVINLGTGGYGVLQMFDLAAKTLPDLKPDLAIIAFISDDLSRSRWWMRTIEWNGYQRPLQSPSSQRFDLDIAIDQYIVNPNITPEWAKAAIADPAKGQPLLGEVITQYQRIREDFHRARNIRLTERSAWTLREFFLWNRITTGMPVVDHVASIPRVEITDYADDPRFMKALAKIREAGVPLLLIHLPIKFELGEKRVAWFGQGRRDQLLAASLERVTGQKIIPLAGEIGSMAVPEKIDLLPHNGHPNRAGLEFYATLATKVVERHLAK